MKILFITPSYKPAFIYGGPIVVTAMLGESLVKMGHEVIVYTTTANGKVELDVEAGKETDIDGVKVFYFKRVTGDPTHVSPDLWKYLNATIKYFDVVHIHYWWNFLVIGAAWICKKNKVKPIISPHGMFSNYILETNHALEKKIIQFVIGKRLLRNSWLHVSTKMEAEESCRIIPQWPLSIIPNLVKLSERKYPRNINPKFTLGFLSRIAPKKGLDILIRSLSYVDYAYELLIAGSGEESYVDQLKTLSKECGNENKIQWMGWKNGEAKYEFLSQIDLFALTSHSENFAIVIIEALSVGTPVLITEGVGLRDYVIQNDAGWVSDMQIEQVAKLLNKLHSETEKIQNINHKLPEIIERDYSEEKLAEDYLMMYQNVAQLQPWKKYMRI